MPASVAAGSAAEQQSSRGLWVPCAWCCGVASVAELGWHGGWAGLADEVVAAEQGVEADEAWSTSELRSLTPVFGGRVGTRPPSGRNATACRVDRASPTRRESAVGVMHG